MKEAINLDLRESLPIIREAFDRKELQMFKLNPGVCSYDGPCAIGVLIDTERRTKLCGTVHHLRTTGQVIIIDDEFKHFNNLQRMHDSACTDFYNRDAAKLKFEELLISLEQEYL